MNWDDVLLELEAAPLATWAAIDLADLRDDPALLDGVRALERQTGARTLADLARAPEMDDVLRYTLPRQERRAFYKAMSGAIRRRARQAPASSSHDAGRSGDAPPSGRSAPSRRAVADDVPRGGVALDEWAARSGVAPALEQQLRVLTGGSDRKGFIFGLRELVDVDLYPHTGRREGLDREALRETGLKVLRREVEAQAPAVALRVAFEARRRAPADAWLAERIALLSAAIGRLTPAARARPTPLASQYPHATVRFEPRPPSLLVKIGVFEHAVSLTTAAVTNHGAHWYGTIEREELSRAILACAIDALSDPAGQVVEQILGWRATPLHEHVIADFRRGLEAARAERSASEEGEERVAFRISAAGAGAGGGAGVAAAATLAPQVVLQRPKKGGGFTVGRKVTTSDAIRTPGLTPLEREILEMCVMLESARFHVPGDAYRARARLFELLSEHPRVHLDDADKTPARVRRARACLRVRAASDGFHVELAVGGVVAGPTAVAFSRLARERLVVATDPAAATIHFAELDDATIALLAALEANPGALTSDGLDALLGAVATCPELAADLELPEEIRGRPVAADERMVVQLSISADGTLAAGVRVRPIAGGPALVPGSPPRHVYGLIEGERAFAARDLDLEEERAERLLAELPLAGTERRSAFDLRTDDLENACDLVATLGDLATASPDAIAVEWAEGARLRVARTLGTRSLRLRVERKRDWFGVRGGADVDGKQIGIEALLAAARAGRRFVRIAGGDLVAIDRELRARLARASDLLHETKDGVVAHPPALSAVSELVESEDEQIVAAKEWLELRARVRSAEAAEPAPLPAGLHAELRPYQLEGYRWMMRLAACGAGGCLADDMGLGKTLQSLAVLAARSSLGPALVVAPTSVTVNWPSEAARFVPGLTFLSYRGPARHELLERLGPDVVLVTSYDILLRDIERLAPVGFATAVFDEAHALKNAQAKRSAAVRRIQADVRFALSGTPIENHTGELWSLFRIVVPGLFGSWERFRERFAAPIERDRDPARRAALAAVVRPYLLRRTKSEVAPELPPRTELVRFVDLSPPERELYEAERLRAIASTRAAAGSAGRAGGAGGDGGDGRFAVLAALTRLRQLACHPRLRDPASTVASAKLRSVLDLIDELKDAGHRALVFSQFTTHLEIVAQALAARKIRCFELDGSTPADVRADRVRRFQAGEADVFLISLKAGGTGLNLTAADYVIHLDPWWNPAAEDQASDRAHRIGQDKPVTVVRVITRGTIEESVLALHGEKRELADAILAGGDAAARLSTQDLFALMEQSAADDAALDGPPESDDED